MSAAPLVLAALEEAEKFHASVSAILTCKVADRAHIQEDLTSMVQTVAAETHEDVEKLEVFPLIATVRVRAHPPLIRALLARPGVERANRGLTQAPVAFGAKAQPTI